MQELNKVEVQAVNGGVAGEITFNSDGTITIKTCTDRR